MKALVIGGGIAGPVVAMSLQRAGVESTVFESRPGPQDQTGLFLNMASNGLDVLRALNIDLRGRIDGHAIPRMLMSNGDGREIGQVANGIRLPDGNVSLCVRRGELQRALREEAISRGVTMHWDKRLVDFESKGSAVDARFADGTEASADFLVGADGIRSAVRTVMDPAAPAPFYTGLLSLGGYTPNSGLAPTPGTQHLIYGKRGFFGYLVRPSGEAWWFANLSRSEEPERSELNDRAVADWKTELGNLFSDDISLIGEQIERAEGMGVYAIHDMPPVPTWHLDRAVLVGDAAHATSPNAGQGASMALEDALELARCVRDEGARSSAFARYVDARRPRTERVVKYSRSLGDRKAPGRIGRRIRDLVMPVALRVFASPRALHWLYGYRVNW